MHPVSCTNTHRKTTDLVIMVWLKIQKLEYIENRTQLSYEIKKILNCASVDTF